MARGLLFRAAVIVFAGVGLGVMLMTGANLLLNFGEVPSKILARIPAPGRRFEAILTMRLTPDTVPTPTAVYVVRNGMNNAFAPVLLADHVEKLRLRWLDSKHLVVLAKNARIFRKIETEKVDLSEGSVPVTVTYEIGEQTSAPDEQPWDPMLAESKNEAPSNFNFGATHAAAGYPKWLLDRWAGWDQKKAGTSRPEWGGPFGVAPYGDDPEGQSQINAGIAHVIHLNP